MGEIKPNPKHPSITIECLFTANDIGISLPEPHPDRAIRIFLELLSHKGDTAIAPRIIKMRRGVLFLQAFDGIPDSGTMTLYECETGTFFTFVVEFEGEEKQLTAREFDELVDRYQLRDLALSPERIPRPAAPMGLA
jgi:hypothetical protein